VYTKGTEENCEGKREWKKVVWGGRETVAQDTGSDFNRINSLDSGSLVGRFSQVKIISFKIQIHQIYLTSSSHREFH
jgi:hypothetical protein